MDDSLPKNIGTRLGDLTELPDELLAQIPSARIDQLEREIVELIGDRFDGVASVDEILVGLYRVSGKIHERGKVAGKLYRMVNGQPKLLESVAKKRGVYRLP